jgi:hypothetical protein
MSVAKSGGPASTIVSRKQAGGGIALDASNIYWSDRLSGVVSKVPRSGGTAVDIAKNMMSDYLAVDADHLYVAFYETSGGIQKIPLAGGAPELVASEQGFVQGMVLDSQFVYWASTLDSGGGVIMKAPTAGGPAIMVASTTFDIHGLVLANSELFWIQDGGVMRVGIAGGGPSVLASGGGYAIAADSSHIYLTGSTLRKISISDGTSEILLHLNDGRYGPGLTLDETNAYWLGRDGVFKFRR